MTRHVSQIASMLEMINSAGGLSAIKKDLLNISVLTEDADKAMLSWANSWKQLQNGMTATKGVFMNFMDGPGAMFLNLINSVLGGVAKLDSAMGNAASSGIATGIATLLGGNAIVKFTKYGKDVDKKINAVMRESKIRTMIRNVRNNPTKTNKYSQELIIARLERSISEIRKSSEASVNPINRMFGGLKSIITLLNNPVGLAILGLSVASGVGFYFWKRRQEDIIKYEEALKDLNKAMAQYNILSKQDTADQAMSKLTANQITQWTHLSSAINTASYALQDVISKVSDLKPIKIMASTEIDNELTGTSKFTRNVLGEVYSAKPEFTKILKEIRKNEYSAYIKANKERLEEEYFSFGDPRAKALDRNVFSNLNDFMFKKYLEEGFNLTSFLKEGQQVRNDIAIFKDLITIQESYGLSSGIMPEDKRKTSYFEDTPDASQSMEGTLPSQRIMYTHGKYLTENLSMDERTKTYQNSINELIERTAKALDMTPEKLEKMLYHRKDIKIGKDLVYNGGMDERQRGDIIGKNSKIIEANTLFMQKYGDAVKESIDSINGFVSAVNSRVEFLKKETVKDLEKTIPTYSVTGLNKMMAERNPSALGDAVTDYFQGMSSVLKTFGFDYNTFDLTNSEVLSAIGEIKALSDDLNNEVLFKLNEALSAEQKFYDDRVSGLDNLNNLYNKIGISDRNEQANIRTQILDKKKDVDKKIAEIFTGDSVDTLAKNIVDTTGYSTEESIKEFYDTDLRKLNQNIFHKKLMRQQLTDQEEALYNAWYTGKGENLKDEDLKKRQEMVQGFIGAIDIEITNHFNDIISELKISADPQKNAELVEKIEGLAKKGLFGVILDILQYEKTIDVKKDILKDNESLEKLNRARKNIATQRDVAIFNMKKRLELIKFGLVDVDIPIDNRLGIMEEMIDIDQSIQESRIKLQAIRAERAELEKTDKLYQTYDEDVQKNAIEQAKVEYELVQLEYKKWDILKNAREKMFSRVLSDFDSVAKVYEMSVSRSEAVYGDVMPTFFDISKNLYKQQGILDKKHLTEQHYNALLNSPLITESKRMELSFEKVNKINQMELEIFDLRTQLLKSEKDIINGMIANSIDNFVKVAKGEKITIDESKAQKELADSLTALMFGEESVESPEVQLLTGQYDKLKLIDDKMASVVLYLKAMTQDALGDVRVQNLERQLNVPRTGIVTKAPTQKIAIPEEIIKKYNLDTEQQKRIGNLINSTINYYDRNYGTTNEVSDVQLRRFIALALHESGWGKKVIGEYNFVGMKAPKSYTGGIKNVDTTEYIKSSAAKDKDGVELVKIKTTDNFKDYKNIDESIDDYIRNDSYNKIDSGIYATDPNHLKKVQWFEKNVVDKILGNSNWTNLPTYQLGEGNIDYISGYNNGSVTIDGINGSVMQTLKNDLGIEFVGEGISKLTSVFDSTNLGNLLSISKALSSFSVVLQGIENAKFEKKIEDIKSSNEESNRKFEMSIENLDTNAQKLAKRTELENIKARQEYDITVAEEEHAIENELVAVNKQLLDQTHKMLEFIVAIEHNTSHRDNILPSQNIVYNIEQKSEEVPSATTTTFNVKSPNGTQKSMKVSSSNNGVSIPTSNTAMRSFIQPILSGGLVNTANSMLKGFDFNLGNISLGNGSNIVSSGTLSLGNYMPALTSSFSTSATSLFGNAPISNRGYLQFGQSYQPTTFDKVSGFIGDLNPRILGQFGGGLTSLVSGLTGDPLAGGIVSGLGTLGSLFTNSWSNDMIMGALGKHFPKLSGSITGELLRDFGGGLSALGGGFQLGTMLANGKMDAGGLIGSALSLGSAGFALEGSALATALGGGALGATLATGAIALPALALGAMATNAKKRQAKYKAAGEWNKKLEKYRDEQIQEQLKALKQQQHALSSQASQQTKAVGQQEALRRSLMAAPLTASSTELFRSHQVSKRGGALGLGRKRKKWVMEGVSATVGLKDFGYSSVSNISDTYTLMDNITKSMTDIQKFLDSRGQHAGSKEDRKEWAEQKARLDASQMLYDQIKSLQESIIKSTTELTQSFFGFEMIGLNAEGNKAAEDEAIAEYDIGAWEKREDLLNVFLNDFINAGNTVGKTIADIFISGVSNAFIKNNSQLNQIITKVENAFKEIGKKVINTDSLLEAAKYELSSGKNTESVYQSILDQLKAAGYGSEDAFKTAQSYLDAKNYKEFVQFLESIIATGNGMGDSVKDLISATNELKDTQKHLEDEMRKFVDEWVQGGGNLSDIIGSMDNILSNSAKIIANIATTGSAIEGFEALKSLLEEKVLPNVQNSIIDALKDHVFDIEQQINDYKQLIESGKLTSANMHSMIQDIGKLFDVLENPFDFNLNKELGITDEVLQKILAYKNTIDEINNALYERMNLDEKISYNQEKLSEEASKYKTQIAKQLEQGGVIDIGELGQISFKELEKKLQDLLAKGEPIPEELKQAIEQANGQYGTLNDTINKLEFDMKQAEIATQKFTEAWMSGLINGDYDTIKSELSEETQSLLDAVLQSLSTDGWDSAGTSIGSSLASSILNTYSNKLINSTQMKETAGMLNKMLFENMNFIDESGTVNFDMMYQLSQNAQKMAVENEATRQRFEAINSMFDYTQDIRYSKLEKDISYKTSSTKESVYNINNYNTFSIGTLVADTLGLEALTRAIAPYMISVFKDLGIKI